MTDFAKRHFDPGFGGTKITDRTYESFIEGVNMNLEIQDDAEHTRVKNVRKGDYEFSRLITFENFTNAKLSVVELSPAYYPFVRSGYSARTNSELPVLSEWLELPKRLDHLKPVANNLTIVLYSKEQVIKENASQVAKELIDYSELGQVKKDEAFDIVCSRLGAIGDIKTLKNKAAKDAEYDKASAYREKEKFAAKSVAEQLSLDGYNFPDHINVRDLISNNSSANLDADWCVVAILAHNAEEQEPMKPITMLRNAAGKEYGGNGEPIDEDKYRESVEFWTKHISLK